MEGGSVTREMIHTRREQVKKQIKQVERLLSREKRATRRGMPLSDGGVTRASEPNRCVIVCDFSPAQGVKAPQQAG